MDLITVRNSSCGKIMLSQASVIQSTGEEGRAWQGEHAWQGGGACMAGETATAADGTHPTGMHSCILLSLRHIDDFI